MLRILVLGSAAGGGRSEFRPAERRVATPSDPSRGPPKLALSVQGLPLLKPPYGRISAIDMTRATSSCGPPRPV